MKFKDHDLIPSYAKNVVYSLVERGLLAGANGYLYNQKWTKEQRDLHTRNLCMHDRIIQHIANENVEVIKKCKPAVVGIKTATGIGTGFLISPNEIVTNQHVVKDSYVKKGDILTQTHDVTARVLKNRKGYDDTLEVTEDYKVKIIDVHWGHDLALLKIDAPNLKYIKIAKNPAKEGEKIISLGHPFGFLYTSTVGYVSQDLQSLNGSPYVQHTGIINPGNSGGPGVNKDGEVVTVNVLKITKVGDTPAEGMEFGVRLKYLREFILKNNISI